MDFETTRILCIRQPLAWLVVTGKKDIENRTWPTNFRGRLGIHAPLYRPTAEEIADLEKEYKVRIRQEELAYGAIVGSVDCIDCVESSRSKWFDGPFGFVLKNAKAYPTPLPASGRLGLFPVPPALEQDFRALEV